MSKTNDFETSLAELVFVGTDLTGIGDAGGLLDDDAGNGSLYVALYTAAPTDDLPGTEVTLVEWANYARVAVVRTAGGWTVSGNNTSNTAAIQFTNCNGGTGCTVRAVALCHQSPIADATLTYWEDLDSNLVVSVGVQPIFQIGELDITED